MKRWVNKYGHFWRIWLFFFKTKPQCGVQQSSSNLRPWISSVVHVCQSSWQTPGPPAGPAAISYMHSDNCYCHVSLCSIHIERNLDTSLCFTHTHAYLPIYTHYRQLFCHWMDTSQSFWCIFHFSYFLYHLDLAIIMNWLVLRKKPVRALVGT